MFLEMESKDIFRQAQQHAFGYADGVRERHVFPTPEAIADLEQFTERLPGSIGNAGDVIEQLHRYGSPASVAQTGGRYFGFVNGGTLPVSLAARWLGDFWDQNSALHVMSPVAAKLEEITEGWLRELLGLPEQVVAGFVSGTSMSIFCGLAAARYRIFQNKNWDINQRGFRGAPPVRIITGRHAHGTVVKAISLLGFGTDNIEWIDCDDQGRIIPSALPELDDSTILILQAGNVSSGAFDPLEEICDRASKAKAWVHVDGAFGLWAAASSELAHLTRGMGKANSFSVDAHKTLNTPYDSGIVLCSDKEALINALQASGSYISYSENRDGMLLTPEMSRRARVIELWAALKYLGKAGVDELITQLHKRALQIAEELRAENFTILNDVVFNQVLVACDNDTLTNQTMSHIQASGECWAGGANWKGRSVIRVSVCSWATTKEDISRTTRAFVAARDKAIGDQRVASVLGEMPADGTDLNGQ
ncbi:Glutamate or tyrosine decarboxylase [Microbulbifer donghaiensis]|uniref:Glutamate or tyrosine decarboxylase n=2 Tax=Microbulbifer donghaiensis TaxID=494016 RepID=A0A1M5FMY0_9GAMM|nr:Glutamate or tyrosine decarboxylase [Microbulbifer donghaiensis]